MARQGLRVSGRDLDSPVVTEQPDPDQRLHEVERAILDRAPEHDLVPTLDRIRELLDLLGSPQDAAPVIAW